MHKGYAFVQFTNPFDARNACLGEDGKMVLSQTLGKYCDVGRNNKFKEQMLMCKNLSFWAFLKIYDKIFKDKLVRHVEYYSGY